MTRFTPIFGCFAVFLLAGCANQQARDTANTERCIRYGVPPGSPGYADCMIRLSELDSLEDRARSERMMAAGAAMQGAAAASQAAQPKSLNCTSVRTGSITNTTCN